MISNKNEAHVHAFRRFLLEWSKGNPRNFPWRYQNDPYRILVSEFMLHRTQSRQVVPIYTEFINRYPSLKEFSKADGGEISIMLHPLGLGWRIKGMIDALHYLWNRYREIPTETDKLLNVPGIGPYIAGAVRCFSLNEPQTLIDTNMVRVVGRVFGLDLKGEARRRKPVGDTITCVVDPNSPRDFYYALIDLAHTVCRPRNPNCIQCPLNNVPCMFFKEIQI